jgi:hypothetical protein
MAKGRVLQRPFLFLESDVLAVDDAHVHESSHGNSNFPATGEIVPGAAEGLLNVSVGIFASESSHRMGRMVWPMLTWVTVT